MFGVWGLGFGVWGLGFEVWSLGYGALSLGYGVRDAVCAIQVLRNRIQEVRFSV